MAAESTALAFGTAFLTTAALWWLYFTAVTRIGERRLASETVNRTTLARDAYTYLHVVLVAGVVVSAVGDEFVIAHPSEALASSAEVAAVVGGPALYLFAHALFRLRVSGQVGWRRPLAALVVAILVLVVVIAVIVADQVAARRAPAQS